MPDPTYSLANYGAMMTDRVRMDAYDAAIAAVCRPGSRVLDIGCGAGILSLLACRHGAARVYAIEPSDAIIVAREVADANGVADRITFIQQMSTRLHLPEVIDVVIADVRGVLPMTGTSLATMRDARRFLAPDGVLIPARDVVRAAVVEAPSTFEKIVNPWRRDAQGFDMRAAERLVLQSWLKVTLQMETMLTAPQTLMTLDYAELLDVSPHGSCTVPIARSGTAHGLLLWFDTTLLDGIGFSNEPGKPPAIYGQAFFPFTAPVGVEAGDVVTFAVRAAQVQDDYVWTWEATIRDSSAVLTYQTRQSTFHGVPLSLDILRKAETGREIG